MGGIIKELKSQLTCAAHLPGELGFFLSAIKNKSNMTNKQTIIDGARALFEDLEDGSSVLHLHTPVRVISTSQYPGDYCLVLEDGFGYHHYFDEEGFYDGWEASIK